MQEPLKFCSSCGHQNNLSAQFCQKCGAQYTGAPPPDVQPRPKQHITTTLLIVVGVAFFGCCGLSGVVGLLRENKARPPADSAGLNSLAPTLTPMPAPTPDLPSSELLARAKSLMAHPYNKGGYDGAMDLLNRIPLAAKEFKESMPLKQKITKAREREEAVAAAAARQLETAARKIGADNVERGLLSQGYDATVTVSGPENRTIRITYVLMSRPLVYQLTAEGKFLNQLSAQGFRRVILSDGYDSTWRFTYNEKTRGWN